MSAGESEPTFYSVGNGDIDGLSLQVGSAAELPCGNGYDGTVPEGRHMAIPIPELFAVIKRHPSDWRDMVLHVSLEKATVDEDIIWASGKIALKRTDHLMWVDGVEVPLTGKCYGLARLLGSHPDADITRRRVYEETWGHPPSSPGDRRAAVIAYQLRQRIGAVNPKLADPKMGAIRTVHGVGYRAPKEL